MCEFYEKICAGPRVFGHSGLFVGRAVFKHPECTGCTESNFQNRCKNGYLCRIGGVSDKILGIITLKIDLALLGTLMVTILDLPWYIIKIKTQA